MQKYGMSIKSGSEIIAKTTADNLTLTSESSKSVHLIMAMKL